MSNGQTTQVTILVQRGQTKCHGLAIEVRPPTGKHSTCGLSADLDSSPAFTSLFNHSCDPKSLTRRHLALLVLLALALVEPARARDLGFDPAPDGALALTDLVRLASYATYRGALHRDSRKRALRKDVTTRFRHGSERGIRVGSDWKIAFHLPDTEIRFQEGAADVAVAWLREEMERSEVPADAGEPPWSMERLPVCRNQVFGREAELYALEEAYQSPTTSLVLVTGLGGTGKSTLLSEWLYRRTEDGARGFAFSFDAQGALAPSSASSDVFIDEALRFFGDPTPKRGTPTERGKRLADLILSRRTVLVLDGLEPLQSPHDGTIPDRALGTLLHIVAQKMNGLCVVTTRPPFTELGRYEGRSVLRINLDSLPDDAGEKLLRHIGVQGKAEDLRTACREQRGHPLALTLLGTFLCEARGGDVRKRTGFSATEANTGEGTQAARIIEEYGRWFGDGPERAILRMMGLFDRPADTEHMRHLRAAPAIPGVTEAVVEIGDDAWNRCVTRLRRAGLLLPDGGDDTLDAHPLVRQFFGALLEKDHPAGFRAAHGRLYEHLRDHGKSSPDTPEDDLEDIQPLFHAIRHAHHACRLQEAFDLYRYRLRRNNVHFTIYQLNAITADLAAQSAFLDGKGWPLRAVLTPADEGWLLSARAFSLRALGNVDEARRLLDAAAPIHEAQGHFIDASVAVGNVVEMSTLLGDLRDAAEQCRREVDFARRSGNEYMLRLTLGHEAHLRHAAGQLHAARVAYEEARARVASCPSDYPLLALYDDVVFVWWYWDMALDVVESTATSDWPRLDSHAPWQVGRAFVRLVHGRLEGNRGDRARSAAHFAEAIDLLRDAGERTWLATGLLARAASEVGVTARGAAPGGELTLFEGARRDLTEALEIARESAMALVQCDAHLLLSRIAAWTGALEEADVELKSARKLLRKTGYRLREPDASLAAAWISLGRGDFDSARSHADTAKALIEQMGYASRAAELREIERRSGRAREGARLVTPDASAS